MSRSESESFRPKRPLDLGPVGTNPIPGFNVLGPSTACARCRESPPKIRSMVRLTGDDAFRGTALAGHDPSAPDQEDFWRKESTQSCQFCSPAWTRHGPAFPVRIPDEMRVQASALRDDPAHPMSHRTSERPGTVGFPGPSRPGGSPSHFGGSAQVRPADSPRHPVGRRGAIRSSPSQIRADCLLALHAAVKRGAGMEDGRQCELVQA